MKIIRNHPVYKITFHESDTTPKGRRFGKCKFTQQVFKIDYSKSDEEIPEDEVIESIIRSFPIKESTARKAWKHNETD